MQKRPKKKSSKMRGRRAMGYGFSAGHRASGQRGGKGRAGTKKHHYVKTILEDPDYFGKHGFKRPQKIIEEPTAVNVGDLDAAADRLAERGLAVKSGKKYTIDITKLGFDKILGSGKVTKKLDLTGVKAITDRAREKITEKGGTVDLPAE
ncbi:MAG: 50S ribosomal protein L15 [Candidatus Thorarchaeota archaeon]|nr:MAG: 50S ribosomal protein L15 [Candidatus Thorarchaeota archaeon]